jgi:hypothetical protein
LRSALLDALCSLPDASKFRIHSIPTSINSDFRIFSRGIVPSYRTTTGPISDFKSLPPSVCGLFSVFYAILPAQCHAFPQAKRSSSETLLKRSAPFISSHLLSFSFRLPHSEFRLQIIPPSVFYHRRNDYKVLRFCFAKKDETLQQAAERLCEI